MEWDDPDRPYFESPLPSWIDVREAVLETQHLPARTKKSLSYAVNDKLRTYCGEQQAALSRETYKAIGDVILYMLLRGPATSEGLDFALAMNEVLQHLGLSECSGPQAGSRRTERPLPESLFDRMMRELSS
ncbi:Hypothetical protein UVM_LOCUS131 [uncultured virus]|nr:Hypothetical protein UVM_LOCUS131 [uncultured virus]